MLFGFRFIYYLDELFFKKNVINILKCYKSHGKNDVNMIIIELLFFYVFKFL